MHATDGPKLPLARPSHGGQGTVRVGSRAGQQRALLNVEKQIHASLRPRGTRTRDAARPAMQRRGSCIADSRPQQ